ncbi:MAG TPA: hypothetical protein VMT88_06090 [Actinomycetes bacterium]|nr:hypothetical protein [Actinomycetes bacterium]
MCTSCGCGVPNEDHGDTANITQDQLDSAAMAANITPEEVAQNISNAVNA